MHRPNQILALGRYEVLLYAVIGMDLGAIMFREISQAQNDRSHIISLSSEIKSRSSEVENGIGFQRQGKVVMREKGGKVLNAYKIIIWQDQGILMCFYTMGG